MVGLDLDLLPANERLPPQEPAAAASRGTPCYFVLNVTSPDPPSTCQKLKKNLLVLRRRRGRLRQGNLKKRDSMLCCGRQKDQGRDIPPNAEPAASPRRLQFGQLATTLPQPGVGRGRELPPMVLQPDFRKVSGISSEIFKQLEAVENDHDATTAAALDAVERRGEMLVRMLDPRNQFSRSRQDLVRKFVSMQDGLHTVHFVEIVKRPGQTLGLYIREGNGLDRYDGVFISRIAIESAVFNSGCLGVGDEILAVNLIDVTHMSLDDVVIIMSIPRRLVLTIRQRKGRVTGGTGSLLRPDTSKIPPVVVIKKDLDEEPFEESNDENNHMGHGPHSFSLSHAHTQPGLGMGRGRTTNAMMSTQGQRLYAQQMQRDRHQQSLPPTHSTSIQSLPRHPASYQHYANLSQIQMNHHAHQLPDVTDYTPRSSSRQDDFRLETPQTSIRRPQYGDYYDPRPEPPPRPSYDWYRSGTDSHHYPLDSTGPTMSYQPPPPVITEQPRSMNVPSHFQPFDRSYSKGTLESLAEKVHTFYTGPRPMRHGGRSQIRMPRTGSDHRISLSRTGSDASQWYGSMPRQRPTGVDYRSHPLSIPPAPRYTSGLSSRLSVPPRRKPVLDYASDSEAQSYTPSLRSSTGLSLPAATRRSLGLTNGRSNSLPRDFIRGGGARGGRRPNVRFDKRGLIPDLTSSMAGRRALLLASGIDSQDESDGAASAPETTPRRGERDYRDRSWMTRAPSTSAIYERLKTNRDVELLQTQRAAKFNYSAENLSILDRARQRTEREIKRLHQDIDRENQAHAQLSAWEASQAQAKEQPYYPSYRSHLLGTGLTGGDSTLARALGAGRSPSTSSALAALGLREGLTTSSSFTKDNLSAETLSRLGLTPSRSRDFAPSDTGRTTPTSALLQRLSAEREKDSESLTLRKEILSRSLLSRDLLSHPLKDDLEEKTDHLVARLTAATGGPIIGGGSLLSRTSVSPSTSSGVGTGVSDSRLKLLTINPSEFVRYKIERPSSAASDAGTGTGLKGPLHGHSGILRVHLLAGRALRSTVRTTDASVRSRDLYCVLECDRVHKARTVVCTGDQNFDWDETFELDLVNNKELDFLIYSWDPQLRHRLCYKGSVNLIQILNDTNPHSAFHQLAIKVEPRGTLYVKLKHTPPQEAFRRELKKIGLFGADVSSVVMREDSGLNVPLIVQRCIEEVERRGLDIIGLYRLCGSATKKQTLREAFERNPRTVDLSAENVPDINVIAGVLKDYLRELPEPLLTKCLYQMLVDALGVCLPDDPEGNARLLFSIIECLPKPNRCTLLLILEHLSLVCSLSDRNKMGPTQLATCFGPILMIYFEEQAPESLDFQPPIKVLQYLLEVWPAKSVTMLQTVRAAEAGVARKGPILLGKGRPFPRSSPASAPSSRSPRTTGSASRPPQASPPTSQPSLPLSPSRPSLGAPSEPSPTAKIQNTAPLTLTPSTTSSSLTSVTTPSSLTPVSSAKSITPATTLSNYSLTSEGSTKSTESPTTTATDIFATVSVRSRVSAFEIPPSNPPPTGIVQPLDPVPPSPFPARKFVGPGHVERSQSTEERETRRKLPSLPQQHSLPQQQHVPSTGNGNGLDKGPTPPSSATVPSHSYAETSTVYANPAVVQKQAVPPPPPPKPANKAKGTNGVAVGVPLPAETNWASSGVASPPSNGSTSSSPSWATVTPANKGQGSENGTPVSATSRVTSPSPASTPPPVPPRLDRRGSEPSPTSSSPPSMPPPPVPPRLGRAAPVRTPSMDSREAFEVDCYTIKEENGEEDYLT